MEKMPTSKPAIDFCTGSVYLHGVATGKCRNLESLSMTWEQRWHPLREEWVIVAAHWNRRPWSGLSVSDEPADESRLRSLLSTLPTQYAGQWNSQ